MARKKKDTQEQKDFRNSPFRSLKGFCVPVGFPAPEKPKKPAAKKERPADDRDQFAREMELLGVQPLADVSVESAEPPVPEPPREVPPTEREEFLTAMGGLDVHFRDDFDGESEPLAPPEPNRMRKVRRGQLLPEAQLDLHGLGREVACEKVGFFLDNAIYHGQRTVLIITGRGNHSEDKPILRSSVEDYLRTEGTARVAEWGRAPQRLGGEGALVVFLRSGAGPATMRD